MPESGQVFSCEFCEIFKNTIIIEHVWATASLNWNKYFVLKENYSLLKGSICRQVKLNKLHEYACNMIHLRKARWQVTKTWFRKIIAIPVYHVSANIFLFKFNNRSTRKKCERCSRLKIEIPERRLWPGSDVFIVNFEHIWHFFLMLLLLTLNKSMLSGVCLPLEHMTRLTLTLNCLK